MDMLLLVKFAAAFVLVISLMFILSWALKKTGLGGPILKGSSDRRLSVIETLPVDHKRRLILVRRDDREHLILLGPESETLIEASIPAVEHNESVVRFSRDPRNVKI